MMIRAYTQRDGRRCMSQRLRRGHPAEPPADDHDMWNAFAHVISPSTRQGWLGTCQNMLIQFGWFRCVEDLFGPGNFGLTPMGHEEKLVRLNCRVVSQNAVFRYTNAVKPRSKDAQPTKHGCILQRGDD